MTEPVALLTGFGRSLRDEGLSVGTGRIVRFCRAASLLEPRGLYWAGRAARRRDDLRLPRTGGSDIRPCLRLLLRELARRGGRSRLARSRRLGARPGGRACARGPDRGPPPQER